MGKMGLSSRSMGRTQGQDVMGKANTQLQQCHKTEECGPPHQVLMVYEGGQNFWLKASLASLVNLHL